MNKRTEHTRSEKLRGGLLLVMLIFGLVTVARGQDCTSDRPTPPSRPDAAFRYAYQSWCERHGGTYDSTNITCTPGPNWCKGNNASAKSGTDDISSGVANALATAIISGNAQTRGTAFGIIGTLFLLKELTSDDNSSSPTVSPSQPEIDRAREIEAARQRWKSLVEELNRNIKPTGPPLTDLRFKGVAAALGGELKSVGSQIPELQTKDVTGASSNDALQFKSVDGAGGADTRSGNGIPGLPGIYVGGPRDGSTQSAGVQGLPGLYLKSTQESTQTVSNGAVIQPNATSPSNPVASAESGASTNLTPPGSAVPELSATNAVSGTEQKAASERAQIGPNRPIAPQVSVGAQQPASATVARTDEAASEQARNEFENAAANIGFSPTKPTPQAPAAISSSADASVVDLRGAKQQSPTAYSQELANPKTARAAAGDGQSSGQADNGQPATRQPSGTAADVCSLVPKAQDDFILYSQETANDREAVKGFGFDRTVEDIESWGKATEDAKHKYHEEARKFLLGKALEKLSNAAIAAAPTLSQTKRASLYQMFRSAGRSDEELQYLAIGTNPAPVHEETFTRQFADDMRDVNEKLIDTVPDSADTINLFNNVLSATQLFVPEAAPLLEGVKQLDSLIILAYEAGRVGNGLYNLSKLSATTEAKLRELGMVAEKFKRDVDALNQAKRILAQAAALPADRSCDSTRLVKMPN
jgi:hypothetical protein